MYGMIKGQEKRRYVSVTAMGHRVVRLYQALLTLVATQEGWFTRSFDSFRSHYPTLRITFDGSLEGTGLCTAYDPVARRLCWGVQGSVYVL